MGGGPGGPGVADGVPAADGSSRMAAWSFGTLRLLIENCGHRWLNRETGPALRKRGSGSVFLLPPAIFWRVGEMAS